MEHNLSGDDEILSPAARQEIKTITEDEAKKKQWRNELLATEAVRKYLEGFNELTVDSFLDMYVTNKLYWVKHGDMYARIKEDEELLFDNEAEVYLKMIQQKKLFDLQCLWRAEKLQLPGIEICYDFTVWQEDILNCPFIENITEEDLKLCQDYLLAGNVEKEDEILSVGWQDYEDIVKGAKTDNKEGWYPVWYQYYNFFRGTANLMLLPNSRGEKEDFFRYKYLDARAEERQAIAAAQQSEATVRKPPLHSFDSKQTEYFVMNFESREIQRLYKAYQWSHDNMDQAEKMEEYIDLLLAAKEPVPIEANDNWRDAIEQAVLKYKCKKIAEALSSAWEQYMINIQTGIAFPKDDRLSYLDVRKAIYEQILHGRKINGYPEDLNF